MTLLELNNIKKEFKSHEGSTISVLEDISFDVEEGEFISIIGPSGSGKSTILRLISALDTDYEGSIDFTKQMEKDLGFVFQDSVLFPWRTVYDNIKMPLEIKKNLTKENLEYVDYLLDMMKLTDFKNSYPKELSGGMKQRVSIARSLSYDPSVLLMDEPFGALDAMTRDTLNLELLKVWKKTGKTILFVTHDIEEAVFLSSKVIVLSNRPTRVKKIAHTEFNLSESLDVRNTSEFMSVVEELRSELNE